MSSENKNETIKCSSCGGDISRKVVKYYDRDEEENISTPVGQCSGCGMKYGPKTAEYYQVFASELNEYAEPSGLKLGLRGNLNGKEYEIIGHVRYQEEDEYGYESEAENIHYYDYDQYDDEDDDAEYEDFEDCDIWDEWVAVSDDGVYHYFVEEEGKFFSHSEYIPSSIDLESDSDKIEFEGKKISKDEGYYARLIFAEGELPYVPEIGERVLCYDITKGRESFSIEKSEDEVSITRGEEIAVEDLSQAFGVEISSRSSGTPPWYKRLYVWLTLLYAGGLILLIASGIIRGCVNSTHVKGIMDKKIVLADNEIIFEGKNKIFRSQVLYGPFEIPNDMSDDMPVTDVSLKVNTDIQKMYLEWQSFRLFLLDKNIFEKLVGKRIKDISFLKKLLDRIDEFPVPLESYLISGEFWDEDGYEWDEGVRSYWHESDLNYLSNNFIIDKKGLYYFYLELYNNKKRNPRAVEIEMDQSQGAVYLAMGATVVFFILAYQLFLTVMGEDYYEDDDDDDDDD